MSFFAKNIRYLREKKGLTQAAMPDELGFSQSAWNNYEKEVSMPRFNDLVKISKFFGVSTDDLVTKDLSAKGPASGKNTKNKRNLNSNATSNLSADAAETASPEDYAHLLTERDNLRKQLEFCNLTIKSLTDHIETLKDAMKLQMTRIEELQLAAKKQK